LAFTAQKAARQIAELALFAGLIVSRHPLMAVVFGASALLDAALDRQVVAQMREAITYLTDPLDAEGPVDIDQLMDRLTNPE
jgi:hypothetical protein